MKSLVRSYNDVTNAEKYGYVFRTEISFVVFCKRVGIPMVEGMSEDDVSSWTGE